jgi:hypothetical protein
MYRKTARFPQDSCRFPRHLKAIIKDGGGKIIVVRA